MTYHSEQLLECLEFQTILECELVNSPVLVPTTHDVMLDLEMGWILVITKDMIVFE